MVEFFERGSDTDQGIRRIVMEVLGVTFGDFRSAGHPGLGALMGLALGLVKAVLFAASWGGAGLVTFYSYEHIKPY